MNLKDSRQDALGRRLTVIQQPTYDYTDPKTGKRTLQKETLLVIKTRNNRLRVIFAYNELLTLTLKTIPYTRWDTKNKWWSTPFSEGIKLQLKAAAHSQHLDFQYEEEAADEAGPDVRAEGAVVESPVEQPADERCSNSKAGACQGAEEAPGPVVAVSAQNDSQSPACVSKEV